MMKMFPAYIMSRAEINNTTMEGVNMEIVGLIIIVLISVFIGFWVMLGTAIRISGSLSEILPELRLNNETLRDLSKKVSDLLSIEKAKKESEFLKIEKEERELPKTLGDLLKEQNKEMRERSNTSGSCSVSGQGIHASRPTNHDIKIEVPPVLPVNQNIKIQEIKVEVPPVVPDPPPSASPVPPAEPFISKTAAASVLSGTIKKQSSALASLGLISEVDENKSENKNTEPAFNKTIEKNVKVKKKLTSIEPVAAVEKGIAMKENDMQSDTKMKAETKVEDKSVMPAGTVGKDITMKESNVCSDAKMGSEIKTEEKPVTAEPAMTVEKDIAMKENNVCSNEKIKPVTKTEEKPVSVEPVAPVEKDTAIKESDMRSDAKMNSETKAEDKVPAREIEPTVKDEIATLNKILQEEKEPNSFETKAKEILRRIWLWIIVGEEYRNPSLSMELPLQAHGC